MRRKRLSRRALLRGAGGAMLALPILEIMLDGNGEALASGEPLPKRFLTFCFGNGVVLSRWTPAEQGAGWQLTPELAPLAPVKSYINVISGCRNVSAEGYQHHGGMTGMWCARPGNPAHHTIFLTATGPSIDQVLADTLSVGAPIRSIETGIMKRRDYFTSSTLTHMLSHRAANQPLPPQYSPKALFNTLFSTALPAERIERTALLDLVAGDAQRLRSRIGTTDRQRLDAHLTAVHELQARIGALPEALGVEEPTEENIDVMGAEPAQSVADAMVELLVVAFKTDLTRVASMLVSGPLGSATYAHLGQTGEQHDMSHDLVTNIEQLHEGIVWNMEVFSSLLQGLAATEEGAGNVLDQTVAICGSDVSEGWDHGERDAPVVIAGGGGGTLKNPGVHYRATNDRNLSDALLAACKAIDPSMNEIGAGLGYSTTPITEILNDD